MAARATGFTAQSSSGEMNTSRCRVGNMQDVPPQRGWQSTQKGCIAHARDRLAGDGETRTLGEKTDE